MIIVIDKKATEKQLRQLEDEIEKIGLEAVKTAGATETIWSLIGDTARLDVERLSALPAVASARRIQKPYRGSDRDFHPEDTVVEIGGGDAEKVLIGGGHFAVIAGPCSVESEEQMEVIAGGVKAAGATLLRGGAFKPRTSPYAFQGLREDGLAILRKTRAKLKMPVVSEIVDIAHLPLFDCVDLIQVGARNMQNYELLKELGRQKKPIMLKRGVSATLRELLLSAEYIMQGGNTNIILCERGIRTFETATRNTLDLSAVARLKELTHLPVIVDPSHATGSYSLVPPMSLAAVAAGADGLMIEVHNEPAEALSDGPQSINMERFEALMEGVRSIRPFAYRK